MDIQIQKEFENKLLKRKEVSFVASYSGKTPTKEDLKAELCKKLGANPEHVAMVNVRQLFGETKCEVRAHVYSSKEAMAVEPKYLGERGKPKEKKEAPQPAATAKAAPEKK